MRGICTERAHNQFFFYSNQVMSIMFQQIKFKQHIKKELSMIYMRLVVEVLLLLLCFFLFLFTVNQNCHRSNSFIIFISTILCFILVEGKSNRNHTNHNRNEYEYARNTLMTFMNLVPKTCHLIKCSIIVPFDFNVIVVSVCIAGNYCIFHSLHCRRCVCVFFFSQIVLLNRARRT